MAYSSIRGDSKTAKPMMTKRMKAKPIKKASDNKVARKGKPPAGKPKIEKQVRLRKK